MNTLSSLALCTLAVAQRAATGAGFGGGEAQTRRNTLDADSFSGVTDDTAGDAVVCSADVLECSDGSYVSRVAPDCEFEDCPWCDVTDINCQLASAQSTIFDLFSGGISGETFEIASPDSLTSLFWDTVSWEDVTLPTADALMSNWLEGVGIETDLSGIMTELEELQTNIEDSIDTSTMTQDEIFEVVQESDAWATLIDTNTWTPDLDFGMFATSLESMANDLQMSSMWDSLPTDLQDTVSGLQADLTAFGFNDLEDLTAYDTMIEDAWQAAQDSSGLDVSDISDQMDALTTDFTEYLTGGTDMTLDTILTDIDEAMTAVSAELADNADNQELVDLYESLEITQWGVTTWNEFSSETELLSDFTGNLDIVLQSIQFTSDFGDVLTYDWLDTFMTSLNDILRVDGNQYSVCDEEYIKDQVWNMYDEQYDWYTARENYMYNCYSNNFADSWTSSFSSILSGELGSFTPDCSCWEGLWADQELVATMNCLMDASDAQTVESQIAECNGEIMDTVDETQLIMDALDNFESLANELSSFETADWVPSFNVEDLSSSLEAISSQVGTLGAYEFSTDSFTDWAATVDQWGTDFNSLLNDLTGLESVTGGDFDLSNLEGAVDAAMAALSLQNPTNQPSAPEPRNEDDDGSSFPMWAWMVVGGCLLLMCILAFYHCYLKGTLESNLALEGEGVGYMEGEIADLPDEGIDKSISPEIVVSGTAAGTARGEVD